MMLSKKFIAMVTVAMLVLCSAVVSFSGTAFAENSVYVESLMVQELPDNTEYYVGDTVDPSGMKFAVLLSDGSSFNVTVNPDTTCTWYPSVLETAGEQEITLTYSGAKCTFDVMVYERSPEISTTAVPSTTAPNIQETTMAAATTRPAETTTMNFITTAAYAEPTTRPATTAVATMPVATRPEGETTVDRVPETTKKPASTVSGPAGCTILINAKKYELSYDQKTKLTAEVVPENTNYKVVWSSSDLSVAVVDRNGNVTACGEGDAIITATLVDGNGSTVVDPYGEKISDSIVIRCTMTIWQKIIRFFENLFSGLFAFNSVES